MLTNIGVLSAAALMALRESECIPTQIPVGSRGRLVKPSQLFDPSAKSLRVLVTDVNLFPAIPLCSTPSLREAMEKVHHLFILIF